MSRKDAPQRLADHKGTHRERIYSRIPIRVPHDEALFQGNLWDGLGRRRPPQDCDPLQRH